MVQNEEFAQATCLKIGYYPRANLLFTAGIPLCLGMKCLVLIPEADQLSHRCLDSDDRGSA